MQNSELPQFQARRVLPVASVITFVGFIDTYLLIPILALYAADLEASVGLIGLIVGLYSIINTPANLLFGRLIDRIGYKIPLAAGLLGDAISMFLYSVCRLPVHLVLVRILHGMTGAAIGPATMSIMAAGSKGQRKGKAMGLYGMAIGVATLTGFGLSGFLASRLGTKAVFLFGGGLLLVGFLLSLLLPSGKKHAKIADTSPEKGWQKAKDLLKRKWLIVSYCSIFAQFVTFGSVVTLLPLYVKSVGMEAFHLGISLAIFSLMFVILQFPSGAISDRVGHVTPTVFALGLGAVALLLVPWVKAFPLLVVLMALYGTAYGILFPNISALVAEHTSPEERGLATGIFHALLTGGVAIGAPLMGWVGGIAGVQPALVFSSGVLLLALVVVMRVARHI